MELMAPIVAVTVHPERARITRRGRAVVRAGTAELVVADLPTTLLDDSVRVAGRSDAAARVLGVDLRYRDLAEVPDDRVRAAEAAVRDAERALGVIDGEDAADVARAELLGRLARRSGDRLAAALADGRAGTARVAEVAAVVAAQLVEVAESRRGHAERRVAAQHVLQAAQAELDRLRGSGRQRREAVIAVEADADGELELELSYVVHGAGWSSAYDARLGPAEGRGRAVGPDLVRDDRAGHRRGLARMPADAVHRPPGGGGHGARAGAVVDRRAPPARAGHDGRRRGDGRGPPDGGPA